MVRAIGLGLAALAWMAAAPAAAQSKLFTETAPLAVVITAPFPDLVRAAKAAQRGAIKPYAATLSVADGAGPAASTPIQIRARGLTRRTGGYCDFPPISLEFGDAKGKGTAFAGEHRLKLVTYCKNQSDYEQRIMLEYLAYKLYNTLTPASYRVRAAKVTYRKAEGDAGVTRFGFVIEDLDDVAKRNKAQKLKFASHGITAAQFDARAAGRAALFEYMIGNLDWDFLAGPAGDDCCHNARYIAAKGATPATAKGVVPIPYDFDYSGFVDAPYAVPPEGLHIEHVTQRIYRGYCVSTPEMPAVIAEFRAHRADMMGLIDAEPALSANFKTKTARFLDGFFGLLDDPARVDSQIVKHCRQGVGAQAGA